jgi:DNA-binding NtrC family response regulator
LKDAAERFRRPLKALTGEALRACMAHEWKGNVRELKSALEQALLLAPGDEIGPADLFPERAPAPLPSGNGAALPATFREAKEQIVDAFERDFLQEALRRNHGNISKAAEEIGMYRQNLQQKIRELGLSVDDGNED